MKSSHKKKFNPSSRELYKEDWVVENLIFLSNNLKKSFIGLEKHFVIDKNILPKGDISSKVDSHTNVFDPPPNKYKVIDEDDLSLRWSV